MTCISHCRWWSNIAIEGPFLDVSPASPWKKMLNFQRRMMTTWIKHGLFIPWLNSRSYTHVDCWQRPLVLDSRLAPGPCPQTRSCFVQDHANSGFWMILNSFKTPFLLVVFPESVWAQGSSNSGGLYLIFSSLHLLIFTSSLTPSHLHIFSHTFSSSHLLSHLLIFTSSLTPSHLHTFSSSHLLSHLLIFASSLTPSHLHIFSHTLLIFTPSLTPSHLHIFSLSHSLSFLSLLSLSFFSLSPSLSFSL